MQDLSENVELLNGFNEHDPSRYNLGEEVQIEQQPWSAHFSALANEREQAGHCPSCGQQLFRLKTRWALLCGNEKEPERIPLNVPLLVDEGKCMVCSKTPKPFGEQTTTTSRARFTEEEISDILAIAQQLGPGTAKYVGPYNEYGEKHGEGELIWSNGDVFQGSFQNDLRHGSGLLVFGLSIEQGVANKGEYVGDWYKDKMHGQGYRRYPNGDVYVGGFESGKRHGHGCFYFSNGDGYWGQWEANFMHGKGRYYYETGLRFEGNFVRNKRFGVGKIEKEDQTLDIFQYVNDEVVGQGVRWSPDRTKAWRIWVSKNSPSKSFENFAEVKFDMRRITTAEATSILQQIQSTEECGGNERNE